MGATESVRDSGRRCYFWGTLQMALGRRVGVGVGICTSSAVLAPPGSWGSAWNGRDKLPGNMLLVAPVYPAIRLLTCAEGVLPVGFHAVIGELVSAEAELEGGVEDGNKGMGPKSMPRKLKLKSSSVSCDPKAIVPGADVAEEAVEVEVMAAAALDREATGEVALKAAGVVEEAGRVPVKAVAAWEREVAGEVDAWAADVEALGTWKADTGVLGAWEANTGVLGTWEADTGALGARGADAGALGADAGALGARGVGSRHSSVGRVGSRHCGVLGVWGMDVAALGVQGAMLWCWACREQTLQCWGADVAVLSVQGADVAVLGAWGADTGIGSSSESSSEALGSVALLFFACGPRGLSLSLHCLRFFMVPESRSASTSSATSARWDLVSATQWMAPLLKDAVCGIGGHFRQLYQYNA
ncbi:hypothetical protein DFH08DRAFT_802346 [Mycena albidolilacea]|uniref:Uncharacterized protein n=1 Tax=Mycena albidolilacea TaxID=1033008 RepID=A0AAD7AHD3_9AGAR|nr:hypothetical protein DFH08DRAFT_802346 [Mycena albidolilacea]